MIDRDTLRLVLHQYLAGKIKQEEITNWAYQMINEHGESEDQLVNEILYSLVSFRDIGLVCDHYSLSREKLEYFINWLEDEGNCNWAQYTTMFDPGKLI